jgi:hypothetical protein
MTRRFLLPGILLLLATNALAGTGRIIIIAGAGFNDSTPAAPIGGNPGTTIGQQRLNVIQRAAERWGTTLDTDVDIRIRASFAPLECEATRGVLGEASTITWRANFPNAPKQDVWYPIALANKLAGKDLDPVNDDIFMRFNSALDDATCFGDRGWYHGFDGKEGNDNALYSVVLHEIGHGLGMAGRGYPDFTADTTGRPLPTIFDTLTYDIVAGKRWDQMSVPERQVSSTNTGNVVWSGPNVTEKAPLVLEPVTTLTVTAPAAVARNYDIGTAGFGPAASRAAISGPIVAAIDAANEAGPLTTDGCSAYINGDAVAGKIVLVDRGTCTFVQKALNAQAAGAIGLIVADNRKETCLAPSMGGSDPNVTIPIISLTQDDGQALRDQLPSATVSAMLRVDPSRRAGTSDQGYVRLYTPCNVEGGSSIYHWDTVASPNLLMEPAINSDLLDSVDLSLYQMMDIGWTQPPRTGRRFVRR